MEGGHEERNGMTTAAMRATSPAFARGVAAEARPDPEVQPKGRRRFTAAYKLSIVAEAERCGPGQLGVLLRREGLYSSHLTKWRRQQATGTLQTPGRRAGPPAELRTVLQQLAKAERENRQLRQRLGRAETIISVQKKLSSLLQTGLLEAEN